MPYQKPAATFIPVAAALAATPLAANTYVRTAHDPVPSGCFTREIEWPSGERFLAVFPQITFATCTE